MKKTEDLEVNVASEKAAPEVKYHWYEPMDKDHTDPIWVCINGKGTMIQRGRDVEVSKEVYEVLMNKRRMETVAFERQLDLQAKADKF